MRIGIVGTRPAPGPAETREYNELLSEIVKELKLLDRSVVIVSGGADGVDTFAKNVAEQRGHKTKVWPANWKKLGKAAGFIRNKQIVEDSDAVLAFPSSWSVGTWDTIRHCYELHRGVRVFMYDENTDIVRQLTQEEVRVELAKRASSAR